MAYGGYGGNMQQIMKQAQMMQKKLQQAQAELAEAEVVGKSGGGMVEVTLKGNKTPVAGSSKTEAGEPREVEKAQKPQSGAQGDAQER